MRIRLWARMQGFTVVELLIVVVVIAILAAITIIAYRGIQQSAQKSAVSATAKQYGQKIATYTAENGVAPSSLANAGLVNLPATPVVEFKTNAPSQPATWCISVADNGYEYYVAQNSGAPAEGDCKQLVSTMTARGIMNNVKTVVFVGDNTASFPVYAFDLRPTTAAFLYKPSATSFSAAGTGYRVEGSQVVAWATNITGPVYIGQRYSSTEYWPTVFKAAGYGVNLTTPEIEEAITQLKSEL